SFASTRGSRTGRTATLMPNLRRSVRPAIMARPVMGSRAGVGLRIRSLSQIESRPLSSTRSTKSQKSSVRAKGQPLKPTPRRIFLVISLLRWVSIDHPRQTGGGGAPTAVGMHSPPPTRGGGKNPPIAPARPHGGGGGGGRAARRATSLVHGGT